ncbi:MAG: preprotein translocase subunit SecE [Eubacteriales bacterium]
MAKKEISEAAEKVAKAEKANKAKKPVSDKGNIFARFGKGILKFVKDFKSEIRKIVWPERKTVLKSTGVVLTVVAVIGVIIFLIDSGLTEIMRLLSTTAKDFAANKTTTVAQATTAVQTTIAATTQAVKTAVTTVVGG